MDVVRTAFAGKLPPAALPDYFDEVFEAFRGAGAWALFEDTRACLERLRAGGRRLAVISNFDSRLFDVLANLGIDSCFEQVILSWHVGAAKPDPAIFRRALDAMNTDAASAWHVGDSPDEDAAGAMAAGLGAVLVDRDGNHCGWDAGTRIGSLLELPGWLP